MGLFSSPYEDAATSLYEMARSGRSIGSDLISSQAANARRSLRAQTSSRLAGVSGDILSRYSSAGIAPGAGLEGIIGKQTQDILASEQQGETQLSMAEQSALLNSLLNQLSMGLSGLSKSSTFGDILSGLTTLSNVALGGVSLYNAISDPRLFFGGGNLGNKLTGAEDLPRFS